MPEQHREFFASLPMVILGSEDKDCHVWASPLFGDPGFIRSPSSQQLIIDASSYYSETILPHLQVSCQLGLLGIDLETRRRNRLNGIVVKKDQNQVTIDVQQSFGNCPQYIQPRRLQAQPREGKITTECFNNWSSELQDVITRADTCFIASVYSSERADKSSGMDVSHRGGQPGFLGFDDHHRLIIPDYPGNSFFNTIGNLTVDPRAGLLFLDFQGGNIITLTMTAEVIWETEDPILCGDHDRMIRLSLKEGYVIHNALPYRWESMGNAI
ncbi:MAG: pyridoxamine 5'-phosphate oxidase family protein [Zhongshania sp.]|uniref:pyridoxamine 5'-phosphate oxidase family protein n=1 Tax=Zhongshania sp. TaxID=1971902 RepID=UPI00261817E2|nr:pyridoxamine 5'-phosphate oxidase family protein [Zhongshania sp.]MDF1693341.1 pyridoxamine 5'-phosphate oxidase family protein [Zhongshania sp.]